MRGKRVRYFAILLVVLTIGYGVFQARVLIQGPVLTVTAPTPGETLTDTLYTVRGKVENSTQVLVNGKAVIADVDGNFSHTLATPEGYGVLIVEAKNRFGRTATEHIEFVGNSALAATAPTSATSATSSSAATTTGDESITNE